MWLKSQHDLKIANCFQKYLLKRFYSAEYTKNKYDVNRGPYNTLKVEHIDFFRNLLGKENILTKTCDLDKYNKDMFNYFKGSSSLILLPKTTEQVSKILSFCNNNLLAICPQGGHTGVAGGATPVFDEIVLSAEKMNNIYQVDENSGVLVCQSGCILENLNNHLSNHNLMLPIDLGSKGSCHIGGCVSTNAGGIRLLKYGNLHGNILGLEIVIADGTIIDCLNTLKKDNTAYHLKHLFIGSEGTLGFVTKVAIQCPVKPKFQQVAFLGAQNFNNVLKLLKNAKNDLAEILSAIEVIDYQSIDLMKKHLNMTSPIGEYPFYLLIEISGSNEKHDEEKLITFFEKAMQSNFILNGIIANTTAKYKEIWKLREYIATTFTKEGYVFTYDISIPLDHYYNIVEEMRQLMEGKCNRVFGFGHLGDENLHLQVAVDRYSQELEYFIETSLFKKVMDLKGSISSEHGIGLAKKKFLPRIKTGETLNLMRSIKYMLDPKGILNPYKIL